MKEFADDNFKFDKNGRKLSKRVENTVGKGEIARYEQFLLFPQCFQKAFFPGASKGVIVWEWVKDYLNGQYKGYTTQFGQSPLLNAQGELTVVDLPGWLSGERVGLMTWWL